MSHPWPDQVALLHLAVEVQPVGPEACTHPIRPKRARTQRCITSLCLISPSAHLPPRLDGASHNWHCTGTEWFLRERAVTNLKPLLSFDYITLNLRESRLSFKLSNLFPNSWRTCEEPRPYPVHFLDFTGPMLLTYQILFPDFPRLDPSPLRSPFWLLLSMP